LATNSAVVADAVVSSEPLFTMSLVAEINLIVLETLKGEEEESEEEDERVVWTVVALVVLVVDDKETVVLVVRKEVAAAAREEKVTLVVGRGVVVEVVVIEANIVVLLLSLLCLLLLFVFLAFLSVLVELNVGRDGSVGDEAAAAATVPPDIPPKAFDAVNRFVGTRPIVVIMSE
jgi:hypothetical protein